MTLAEVLHRLGFSKSQATKNAAELRRLLTAAGWRPGFREFDPETYRRDGVSNETDEAQP